MLGPTSWLSPPPRRPTELGTDLPRYGVSSAGLRAFFPRTISGDKSETFEESAGVGRIPVDGRRPFGWVSSDTNQKTAAIIVSFFFGGGGETWRKTHERVFFVEGTPFLWLCRKTKRKINILRAPLKKDAPMVHSAEDVSD